MIPTNILDPEYVEQCIKDRQFVKIGAKTMICLLILDNDFEVVGCSHPLHIDAFDEEIGKTEAYKDAFNKAFEFIAFRLHDMRTPADTSNEPVHIVGYEAMGEGTPQIVYSDGTRRDIQKGEKLPFTDITYGEEDVLVPDEE